MNNKPSKEEQAIQKEFVAFLKKKYGDKLDEKKLQQLKESGQIEKDIQEFKKAKQQEQKVQAQKAAHGAKLDYIKTISHKCPEGQELYYFKVGGKVGCGCKGKKMENGGEVPQKFKKTKVIKIEPSDTIHTKQFGIRNLNRDKQLKNIPQLTNEQYRKLSNSEQLRVHEKDEEREAKKQKCGGKVKKHQQGGSLNGIPFISGIKK